VAAEERTLKL